MPIGDALIKAMCDKCDCETDEMNLTPLAGGGWDARNIRGKLRKIGWSVEGEVTICEECVAAMKEAVAVPVDKQ